MFLNQPKDESIYKFANQMITDHRNVLDQLTKSVNKKTSYFMKITYVQATILN